MKYHDITKDDMKNGDGLRAVLWVSGCGHHCEGCQNPLTWDPEDGLIFDDKAKKELFNILLKPYISGVTFSGGDPLYPSNREEITKLCIEIKEQFPSKTIWLYTGDLWEAIYDYPLMKYVDVCVDGEFILEKRDVNLMWKGSPNQRVIDVKASLKQDNPMEAVLYCGDYYSDPVTKNILDGETIGTSCTF